MTSPIRFRPHHFLCALGFRGEGYSDAFTRNMAEVVNRRLRGENGDEETITVTIHADTLCGPCPERRGQSCVKADKIARLDKAHAHALGLGDGDRLTWGDAKARIAEAVAPEDLDQLCQGCQWLSLGYCKAAIAGLRQSTP
ncbi:DUF1284 domain-containing protein [Shimia biformata]|uniref:DUF1284 domain-containing protein n=1 Tax=Shimia biformata TaxID=1294299 RepID=UPI00194EB241|nr:DUF1284 domain-containing protein [Shimia biformata]